MQEPEPPLGPSLPPNLPRRRRHERTVYSAEQRQELEQFFQIQRYPTYAEREALAARLSLEEQQVQVWFKNRRAKDSKLLAKYMRQGQEAPAQPQGPGAPAPAPALLSASPWFPEDPEFPWGPVLPGHPVFPGGPGFCSPPPPSPWEGFPAAELSLSRHSQAWLLPAQGAPDLAQAAPAPAPVLAPAGPQGPYASSFSPDPVVSPGLTELLSLQDPLEGPSSAYKSENPEDDFAVENE